MKKGFTLFVLGLFLVSLFIGFASAQPARDFAQGARDISSGLYEIVRPILETITGDTTGGQDFLAKVLFLVIIFAVIWTALNGIAFFSENTWVLVVVSVAASILSIRWFGDSTIVQTAILPYSALGIAISCGLPFVLCFFIIEKMNKTYRKLAWIFFAVIFVGLWISRDETGSFGYIYLVTALLAIIASLFDATIQKTMQRAKIERINASSNNRLINELRDELEATDKRYKTDGKSYMGVYSGSTGHAGWEWDRKDIKKRIENIKAGN
jgi:hypothetical protein